MQEDAKGNCQESGMSKFTKSVHNYTNNSKKKGKLSVFILLPSFPNKFDQQVLTCL